MIVLVRGRAYAARPAGWECALRLCTSDTPSSGVSSLLVGYRGPLPDVPGRSNPAPRISLVPANPPMIRPLCTGAAFRPGDSAAASIFCSRCSMRPRYGRRIVRVRPPLPRLAFLSKLAKNCSRWNANLGGLGIWNHSWSRAGRGRKYEGCSPNEASRDFACSTPVGSRGSCFTWGVVQRRFTRNSLANEVGVLANEVGVKSWMNNQSELEVPCHI